MSLSVCPCRTAPDHVGLRDSVEVGQRSHRKTSGDPPGNVKSLLWRYQSVMDFLGLPSPIPLGKLGAKRQEP